MNRDRPEEQGEPTSDGLQSDTSARFDVTGGAARRVAAGPAAPHRSSGTAIKLEEIDDNGMGVVRAELPGIVPSRDVQISVDHGQLRIRAQRREEHRHPVEGLIRSEFKYGAFARSVPLPVGVTDQDVTATYRDGILEIRFPLRAGPVSPEAAPAVRG